MTMTIDKKKEILGIYAVKSPYHETEHYLPYIITTYRPNNNTYEIMTVEYKGTTAYQVEQNCTEAWILELIAKGTIIKKANPNNFRNDKDVIELIRQFSNANNQEL